MSQLVCLRAPFRVRVAIELGRACVIFLVVAAPGPITAPARPELVATGNIVY